MSYAERRPVIHLAGAGTMAADIENSLNLMLDQVQASTIW